MRIRTSTAAAALALALFAAAGCGGTDEASPPRAASAGSVEGVTVKEALDTPGKPLTVHGWIVERAGLLRLCTTREETDPPGCGEPSLLLDGYAGTISAIEEWTLIGTVEGTTLLVDMSESLAKNTNG